MKKEKERNEEQKIGFCLRSAYTTYNGCIRIIMRAYAPRVSTRFPD